MYANLCSEKLLKKLVGKKNIEDALRRLDKLTQEEARMAAAQILSLMHAVDDNITGVGNEVKVVGDKMDIILKGTPVLLVTFIYTDCIYVARWKGYEVVCSANVKQRRRYKMFVISPFASASAFLSHSQGTN